MGSTSGSDIGSDIVAPERLLSSRGVPIRSAQVLLTPELQVTLSWVEPAEVRRLLLVDDLLVDQSQRVGLLKWLLICERADRLVDGRVSTQRHPSVGAGDLAGALLDRLHLRWEAVDACDTHLFLLAHLL